MKALRVMQLFKVFSECIKQACAFGKNRANHAPHVSKALRKAIIRRSTFEKVTARKKLKNLSRHIKELYTRQTLQKKRKKII